jgi:hypothetical protein
MRFIVTGGCGFVGQAICREIVEHLPDARIVAFDNLRRAGSELNRQELARRGVVVVHGDVRCQSDVDALGDSCFAASGEPSQRHRVRDDLPGNRDFCPLVRRTPALAAFADKRLHERVRHLVAQYDARLLQRVAQFLYLKETKSSFEIEREHPDRQRTLRFVELLRETNKIGALSNSTLVDLQRAILDPRYAKDRYRIEQNYVGQTLPSYRERIHYISPRPQDVESMMNGWLRCNERLAASTIDPVVQAAALGFGFVYIHPFDDGNGRLHRDLIHHVLSRSGFTPDGIVLPVSAAMLASPTAYDRCLESFSVPLLPLLDFLRGHGVIAR